MEDTTMYTQQLHIHALSKKKYFSRVVYAPGKFRARKNMYLLIENLR